MTEPSAELAQRRRQALELRLAGATYEVIAQQVGYATPSGAHHAVQAELKARVGEQGEAVTTELARLDAMLTGLWAKARRGDVQAIDRALRISERRMQLLAVAPAAEPVTPEATVVDELAAGRAARRADAARAQGAAPSQ